VPGVPDGWEFGQIKANQGESRLFFYGNAEDEDEEGEADEEDLDGSHRVHAAVRGAFENMSRGFELCKI